MPPAMPMTKDPMMRGAPMGGGMPASAPSSFELLRGGQMPQMPDAGAFDLLDALRDNPPDPQGMSDLIDETDRVESMLADDPAPRPEVLDKPAEDLKEMFRERLNEAAGFKQGFVEQMWNRAWDDYHLRIDPKIDVWGSKMKMPYLRSQVQTSIPMVLAAAFGSGTILRIKPGQPEFQKRSEAFERLIQKQLTSRNVKARKVFADFLWYRALFGTGVLALGWNYEQRMMMVTQAVYDQSGVPGQQGPFLGKKRVLKSMVTHDEPEFRCVDLANAFPCPWTRLDKVPYMIERIESTREECMARARSGAFGEEAEEDPDTGAMMSPEEAVEQWFAKNPTLDMLDQDSVEASVGTRSEAMQRVGMRSPYQDAGTSTQVDEGPKPCVYYLYSTQDVRIVFAGDGSRRILGKQGNPYDLVDLPYIFSQYERTPGIVWGEGIGMIAGTIQRQMDFDINHVNDARRLALNPVLKRRRVGAALMGEVKIRPGAFLDVREQDDIEPLELVDKTSSGLEWNAFLQSVGDRAVGVGDLQRGMADVGVNTATEATIQDSNAVTRKLTHVFEIRDVWEEIGHVLIALNKQFYDKETMIRVAGAAGLDWQPVTPEDTIGEFDVEPNASLTRSDIVLRRRDMLTAVQIFNGDPLTNQHELRRRFWAAMDEERIDDILQPLPPPPADPSDEEIALNAGYAVPVSPEEDFATHFATHQMALDALLSQSVKDTRAIVAHQRHLQETMQTMAMARMQMQMGAMGGGTSSTSAPGGNGSPVREKATALGQAQGSDGQDGESPGPRNPSGRPVRDLP